MKWSDLGDIIGKVAPIVGTAIAGPAGGTVGSLVSNLLGVDNTPDAVAAAIKADPELALKIKTLELQAHQADIEARKNELDAKQKELDSYIADTQSARSRQVEHEKATGETDVNLYVLAWVTVIGFFSLVGILMFVPLPQGSTNIVYLLLGALTSNTNSVYTYFFGSSKGSSDKSKMLNIVNKQNSSVDKK